MGYQHIEVETANNVATLWLNRPEKLNAMSRDMWEDIPRAMESIDADDEIRAVVLAGRGNSFTVGIDVAMLSDLAPAGSSQATSNKALYETIKTLQLTASVFAESPKPVIAAVSGYCLGAGMDLITACDIRLASAEATFSIRETKMALVADIGTLQRLPKIIGSGHTAELAYTGRDIDAPRALEIGLVNSLAADAPGVIEAAQDLGQEIAVNSPLVVQGIKRVLAANDGKTVSEALDYVAQWNSSFLMSNDLMEATNAFIEKRPPRFTGS